MVRSPGQGPSGASAWSCEGPNPTNDDVDIMGALRNSRSRLEAKAAGPPVQRHAPSRPGVLQPCEPTRRGGRAGFRRTLRSEVDARAMLAVNGEKRVPDKDDQFMTMSPTAVRTARRNLMQRIDRFVRRIQTEGFQPGPDANCQLRDRTRMPGAGRLSRL